MEFAEAGRHMLCWKKNANEVLQARGADLKSKKEEKL
jgi:hypothetical protein